MWECCLLTVICYLFLAYTVMIGLKDEWFISHSNFFDITIIMRKADIAW